MIDLPKETKSFALDIIHFCEDIKKHKYAVNYIRKQLTRSACSMAANYRSVCRARSDKEFYSKISIVVEEMDESVFWLELLKKQLPDNKKIQSIYKRAIILLKILAKSRKTVRRRL